MINVKDQVYKAIKDICTNVSDSYPSEWAKTIEFMSSQMVKKTSLI